MKKVVILLFLLATVVSIKAQTLARYSVSDSPAHTGSAIVSPLYRQVYAAPMSVKKFSIPGEKKKKVGSVMTVLGGALFVGGIIVYASGDPNYESTTYNQTTGMYETTTVDPKQVLGVFMCVVGTGVAVPGIIIWSKGIRQYNKYMREQEQSSFRLGVGGKGAVLSYKF